MDLFLVTADTFDNVLAKAEHALVVFYAPWCGHCKRIKPEFEKAAARIKKEKVLIVFFSYFPLYFM